MTISAMTAGVLLGLAGGAHCVAMCGGIATALGRSAAKDDRVLGAQVFLATGRLGTYALIGALGGLLGLAIGEAMGPALASRMAFGARLAVGFLLVGLGLALAGWLPIGPIERLGLPLWQRLRPWLAHLGKDSTLPGPLRTLALGGIWGMLPCGLVYAAAVVAAATGSALEGALFMTSFGIGTLPAVVGVGTLGSGLWARIGRRNLRRASGLAVSACGVWTLIAPMLMRAGAHAHH